MQKLNTLRKLPFSIFFAGLCASSASAQNACGYHEIEFYDGCTNEKAQPNIKNAVDDSTFSPCVSKSADIFGIIFQSLFKRRGLDGFNFAANV